MATILITGGTGLIGTALTKALVEQGHAVRHLGRGPGKRNDVASFTWDPIRSTIDPGAVEGVDRIVHLAGAGIADKRWTQARVQELMDSRARSAELLLQTVRAQGIRPEAIVSAAGINYYGAIATDHVFAEQDAPGNDTIARISVAWEQAVDEWTDTCRVVKLRTPIVLARAGPLQRLAAPVRWGLGAPLGSGRQWMPWVHIDDLVAIYMKALFEGNMSGTYNVNTGRDVTNAAMMRTTAQVLRKPFFFPAVPAFALRLVLGDLSTILLEGSRASNQRLLDTGFRFTHPELRTALEDLLG